MLLSDSEIQLPSALYALRNLCVPLNDVLIHENQLNNDVSRTPLHFLNGPLLTDDGRQVITKAHMVFSPSELKNDSQWRKLTKM